MHKIAIGVCVAALGLAAAAQAGEGACCADRNKVVVDRDNKLVGAVFQESGVLREMGGDWYAVSQITRAAVKANALFYYSSMDCSGTPSLADIDFLPRVAFYDGQRFYTADDPPADFTWASYAFPASPAHGGQCFPYGPCGTDSMGHPVACHATGGQAVLLQSATFNGPLRVRLQGGP